MRNSDNTGKKLTLSIIAVIILSICLAITSFALTWSIVSVDNNFFKMGIVKINLNDGQPIIREGEFLFEPGMTVKKDFFLENESTDDVYYRLYFTDVYGGLADVLRISVCEGDKTLFSGRMSDLTKDSRLVKDTLMLDEKKLLSISFHFPEDAGNETMNYYLSFNISADAVQIKNNPDGLFD